MYQKKAPCTIALAAVNIIVFLILSFQGMTEDAGFMLEHGAMYTPDIIYAGKYYELFTCMFLHYGFEHLMNNMLALVLLGWQLEHELGRVKYVLLYLLSGLAGNLLSLSVDLHTEEYAVSAGASGAIFGIIGALLYIAVRSHGRVGSVSGRGILFMMALTLYHGFTSGGVDNSAHIGGALAGFVLAVILYRRNRNPGQQPREEVW
ncbi:MAG: rhomboid family intramembrane serine protease [Dorea sp.]|nr:rhomboid family intramembrane serine protease [Dorea sp.]